MLLAGEDAQDLFVARLHCAGEFLHFPCAYARVGEDEVDVVAVEGVVDRDGVCAAGGEGDVAEDAVAAEGDAGEVVVGEGQVAGVVEEGDVLFLFARDAAQAEEVAVDVVAVLAGAFARSVFFLVGVDERLDVVAVVELVDGVRGGDGGRGYALHVGFAPVLVLAHVDVFAAALDGFLGFVLGVLQRDLHDGVAVVVF